MAFEGSNPRLALPVASQGSAVDQHPSTILHRSKT